MCGVFLALACVAVLAAVPAGAAGSKAPQQQSGKNGKNQAQQNHVPTAEELAAQQRQQAEQAAETAYAAKVQDLINRAEASYNSGLANYNGNRLDAARMDFDNAVDTMLASGMDLKNDPQLSDELERLLSAINSLELVALKQGNGFSPKLEEAPADAADEVTFAPNPVLVDKVTAELKTTTSDLPLVINDYVAGWIDAFTNKPGLHAHLVASLRRAGKYQDMIERILKQYGVPQDLIYQAVTESGFQPQVLNRKSGCAGMWQFQPFADAYGLEKNGYFDERFDPEKSTIAYAKYMKALYNQFGDWYLAMAAYDWGPGRVQRVVSRTGYADYWEIYKRGGLPAETKAYIPSVIAAIIMARNPEQYGLTDVVPDAPVVSDTVTTNYAIDVKLVADLTDATVPEVVALNPAMLRLTTPADIPYDLHLPAGTHDAYVERLKEIPEDRRASWRFHVVKAGETLDQIAESLHAKASDIASANGVTALKPIEEGDELVVPVAASNAVAGQDHYRVMRGDTLVTVADRFGVTVEDLRAWNHLTAGRLTPGRSIYVAEPIRLAPGMSTVRGRHNKRGAHTTTAAKKKKKKSTAR